METQGPEKIGWPSWRTRPISGRPKPGFGVLGADVEAFVVIYNNWLVVWNMFAILGIIIPIEIYPAW